MRADTFEILVLVAAGLLILYVATGRFLKGIDGLFAKRERTDAAVRRLTAAMTEALRDAEPDRPVPPPTNRTPDA